MYVDAQFNLTPIESTVSIIWAQEFGTFEIRPDSDLFELSGDSLLMLNVLLRVGERLGVEVLPAVLFESSTLRAFCQRIDLVVSGTRHQPSDGPVEGVIWAVPMGEKMRGDNVGSPIP